ncbi:MAG: outer membrane protein assembly factor BamB [Gammaproteobacteria bacterium]
MAAILISGCSSWFEGEDNREPPTPLKPIEQKVSVAVKWQVQLGSDSETGVRFRPAYVDGKVFAATSDGNVSALQANNGGLIWRTELDTPLAGGVAADQALTVVSTLQGDLIALSSADGSERWRTSVGAEVLAPAAVTATRVIVRSANGKLVGFDARDGTRIWQFERKVPALSLRGTSQPQVADGLVAAGFDNGKLVVLKADDGTALWERSIAIPSGRSELDRMVDLDGDPVIAQGVVFATAFQGRTLAMELKSGRVGWAIETSSYNGLAIGPLRIILVDPDSDIWTYALADGSSLWKQTDLHARLLSKPAVLDGYAVVIDLEGFVHWVSMERGFIEGRIQLADMEQTSGPVIAGDLVLIQSNSGKLVALSAN